LKIPGKERTKSQKKLGRRDFLNCHQKVQRDVLAHSAMSREWAFLLPALLLKTAASFLPAAFLLLDLQTIQHSLEGGPQLGKVLLRRDEDEIQQTALSPWDRNQPVAFAESLTALLEGRCAGENYGPTFEAVNVDVLRAP
jgi:hypothetical protein